MANEAFDAVLLRTLARAHGLERADDELVALLPGFRGRRSMAAEVAAVELDDVPLATTFVVPRPGPRAPLRADDAGGSS